MLPTKREGPGAPKIAAEKARFEPVPGAIVADKYRIERTLGEGGMGLVVAATHLGLEQPVAIKFLLPEAARSKVAVERFLREARVAARLRSEYVARVHDVGTLADGIPYIVMEHLQGIDLGKLISRGGALPISETSEIMLQACEALAEVHTAGIVHRDLKPSNLFVTRRADGSPAVKLLDFGISKLTLDAEDSARDPALTATTTIMGSPSYMSPEQLKSTKEVDPRTDIWSLGTVTFEALAGRAAFKAESVPQVCAMIASEAPPPLSALRPGLPPELERAVMGCLEKDPDKRILLVDLANALSHFAPARARSSMERIQATLGTVPSRPRAHTPASKDLPVLPLATAARAGTASDWPDPRRRWRGLRRVAVLLVLASGVLAGGLYVRKLSLRQFKGGLADATSAVASAANAVSSAAQEVGSAANAVTSAVASSFPAPPEVPSARSESEPAESSSESTDAALADASSEPAPVTSVPKAVSSAKPHPSATPAKPQHPAKSTHKKKHKPW